MSLMLALYLYLTAAADSALAGCPGVELVRRAEWGARAALENDTMRMPVHHLFVHHTAGSPCSDFAACAETARAIQKYHMVDRGWDDVGYNFLVGGDGRAYEGRGWTRVGAHTYGFNRLSVAFALMGDFTAAAPTEAQLRATRKMALCAEEKGYVSKDYKLHGHRDGGCTLCPGDALYAIIKTWPRFQGGPVPGTLCWKPDTRK